MVENVAAAVTVFTSGIGMMTYGDRGSRLWKVLRGILAVTWLFSGYLALPLFGPEDSRLSLLTMMAVLWLPQVVLSFVLSMRGVPVMLDSEEPED